MKEYMHISGVQPGAGMEWAATQCADPKAAEDLIESGYRRLLAKYGGDAEYVQALQLERQGGKCMYCHREFKRVTCGGLYWYVPGCVCYPKCVEIVAPYGRFQGCGKNMVYERFKGLRQCASCFPPSRESEQRKDTGRAVARKAYRRAS